MPYKSLAQAAYFNIHRKELEKQGVNVNEWNKASKGMHLPKRKRKGKYQFGGNDEQSAQDNSDFFNTLYQAASQKQQADQQQTTDNTQTEIQPQQDYSSSFDDLSSQIEDLKNLISNQSKGNYDPMVDDSYKNDDMLSLLFSNDNNDPIVFGESPSITNTDVSGNQTYNYNTDIPHGFSGIYRNEGAATGQQSKTSSALGRGQMVRGTRMLMYKKLGITDTAAAEQKFRTDPNFEATVNNAYREDLDKSIPPNITGKQREYMIAKGWYTGNPNYPDNKVPHPEAGNKLTAGQYAERAIKQTGGAIANTPEELYRGLNNTPYDAMTLNLPDTFNTIRGLDSGQPVLVKDSYGNKKILKGNKDTTRLRGKVYELKIK